MLQYVLVRRRAVIVGTIVTVALLSVASTALADTVTLDPGVPTFVDDGGESSAVRVRATPGSVTFEQAGDPISSADAACQGGGTEKVTCSGPEVGLFVLELGDGDDVATAAGTLAGRMSGGEGNDRLTGSDENAVNSDDLAGDAGDDVLDTRDVAGVSGDGAVGGDGNDTIKGGSGDDSLAGDGAGSMAPGRDVITPGGGDDYAWGDGGDGDDVRLGPGDDHAIEVGGDGANDRYAGGPGFDEIAFDNATIGPPGTVFDAFAINLAAGRGGRANHGREPNTLAGFDDVLTGIGDDLVTGTPRANTIDTGAGDDAINPRKGADTVLAREGDDRIDTRDGFPDRVQCGHGDDTVRADSIDELAGCERVRRARA